MARRFFFLLLFIVGSQSVFGMNLDSIPLLFQQGILEVDHVSYTVKEDGKELTVQFWYPSEMNLQEKNESVPPIFDKSQFSGLLQKQSIYSQINPPKQIIDIKQRVLEGQSVNRPVLVFFAGLGLDRVFTTALYERLASNGFVIIEIDLPEIGFSAA